MFLFESLPWYSWVMWRVVLGAVIALNEVTRRWKLIGCLSFMLIRYVPRLAKTAGC